MKSACVCVCVCGAELGTGIRCLAMVWVLPGHPGPVLICTLCLPSQARMERARLERVGGHEFGTGADLAWLLSSFAHLRRIRMESPHSTLVLQPTSKSSGWLRVERWTDRKSGASAYRSAAVLAKEDALSLHCHSDRVRTYHKSLVAGKEGRKEPTAGPESRRQEGASGTAEVEMGVWI